LPDQRTELALGDLVSGEERYVVLMLEVLPLPLLPNGSLPISLEERRTDGEKSEAVEEKTKRKPRVRVLRGAASGRAMGRAELKENKWAVYLKLIQSTSSGLVIRVPPYPKMIASGLSTLVHR
jgi:hypothetical protein